MFEYKTRVKIYDTDAAGVIFFGSQFRLIQDAYEEMLEQTGYSIKYIVNEAEFTVPLVHAESDYIRPMGVGDEITIALTLGRFGESSYTVKYEIFNEKGEITGRAKTVHVTIDKKTMKKVPLPENFIEAVKSLCF